MPQKNRTIGTVCLKSYNAFGFCVDKYWPSEVMMMIKLALRGDDDDQDGNLKQLIHMKAYSDTMLKNWLVKKDNVYTSQKYKMKSSKQ